MGSFDRLILFILAASAAVGFGKLVLAVKAPDVYKTMEEIDEKRRERVKKTALGATRFGLGVYRMLRK
jgi:hypothetical protein